MALLGDPSISKARILLLSFGLMHVLHPLIPTTLPFGKIQIESLTRSALWGFLREVGVLKV